MKPLIEIGRFKPTGDAQKDIVALAVLVQKTFEDMASKVITRDDLPKAEGTLKDASVPAKTVTVKNGLITEIT
jgi:hypothetical protein